MQLKTKNLPDFIESPRLQLFSVHIRSKGSISPQPLKSESCAFFFMDLIHFNPAFFPLLLLALPLFSVFFSINCDSIGQCLQSESSALLQLKRGFITNKLESWRPGTDCCAWDGVTCDESRRVISLDLRERKMAAYSCYYMLKYQLAESGLFRRANKLVHRGTPSKEEISYTHDTPNILVHLNTPYEDDSHVEFQPIKIIDGDIAPKIVSEDTDPKTVSGETNNTGQ